MYLTVRAVENGLYPEVCHFRFVSGPIIDDMVDFQYKKEPFRLKIASIHYLNRSEIAPADADIKVLAFAIKYMPTAPDHYCFGARVISGWPEHDGQLIEGWIDDDGDGLFILATPEVYVLTGFDRKIKRPVYTD